MTIYTERPAPLCQNCNELPCCKKGTSKLGFTLYRKYCKICYRGKHFKPWILHRKKTCEECGFIPKWIGQLDVDHIDCNKNNNDPSNLQTLCANCHRLKTHLNEDYKNKKKGT